LTTHGANVNCEGGDHVTALGAADFAAHTDIVELLTKHGAKPLRTERSPSKHDNGTIVALERIAEEVGKGRMKGVEKRAEVVIKEFQVAISKKQGKALDVLVNIGVGAFKVAVKVGREIFLEFLTKTGMGILQLAVADNFEEGVRKLTRAWSKALIYAVKDEKSLLVRRMLELCVMDFKGLIEAERDDEARSLIKAGIEIQFAIIELENKSMMAIMTELWVDALEELPRSSTDTWILSRTAFRPPTGRK
jgi:hypothetical protein